MAKIFTVTEAREMEGMTLAGVTGKITEVGKRFTGENTHGPWSLQNAKMTDGKSTIKLFLNTRDEMAKSMVGKTVTFLSVEGEKGLHGVTVEMGDAYEHPTDPKKSRPAELQIKVTKTAEIAEIGSGEAAGKAQATAPSQQPAPAPKPAQGAPEAPAANAPVDGTRESKARLMQYANLADMCIDAAGYLKKTHGLTDEEVGTWARCLYISMERGGNADKMPSHPLKKA